MTDELNTKLRVYYLTAIFSLLFAIIGFSYNAWRLEVTEDNNNIRTASFEVLTELAELEQIIFAAYYDQDPVAGSPRKGWVKIGLISDLSALINSSVEQRADDLKSLWSKTWQDIPTNRKATDNISHSIDEVRAEIKSTLKMLK